MDCKPLGGEKQMKSSTQETTSASAKHLVTDKAVRLLASSIYRHLQDEGCEARDIISVSSQLIGLVTTELQRDEQLP